MGEIKTVQGNKVKGKVKKMPICQREKKKKKINKVRLRKTGEKEEGREKRISGYLPKKDCNALLKELQ